MRVVSVSLLVATLVISPLLSAAIPVQTPSTTTPPDLRTVSIQSGTLSPSVPTLSESDVSVPTSSQVLGKTLKQVEDASHTHVDSEEPSTPSTTALSQVEKPPKGWSDPLVKLINDKMYELSDELRHQGYGDVEFEVYNALWQFWMMEIAIMGCSPVQPSLQSPLMSGKQAAEDALRRRAQDNVPDDVSETLNTLYGKVDIALFDLARTVGCGSWPLGGGAV